MKPACKPSVAVVSSKTSPRWVYMWLLFRRLFVLGPCTFRPFNIFGSLLLDKEQKTVKTDALFCFPVLNISNEQTVLVSNISFSTFSQFCTVNNCLCSWKTHKCPKFTRKSKDNFFFDKYSKPKRKTKNGSQTSVFPFVVLYVNENKKRKNGSQLPIFLFSFSM